MAAIGRWFGTGTPDPQLDGAERLSAARTQGLFILAGGFVAGVLGPLLPGFDGTERAGQVIAIVIAGVAVVVGLFSVRRPDKVPRWWLNAGPFVIAILVGTSNVATGDSSTGSQLFLLWPVVYAASYLSVRLVVALVVVTIGVEAVTMLSLEPLQVALIDTLGMAVAFGIVAAAITAQRRQVRSLLAVLSTQAFQDPLTGLPNRRAFDAGLERALTQARRTHLPVALALVDLDRFKTINDDQGHLAGDRVLQQVATCLRTVVRSDDVVARLGGDEFAVILPGCGGSDAAAICGRIVAEVARTPVSVSVGLASGSGPVHGSELMRLADAALYQAKASGGDTWISANSPSVGRLS